MSILQLLSRLSPIGCELEYVDNVSIGKITSFDIAASLKGLTKGPMLLAYWYATNDDIIRLQLRDCLLMDVERMAAKSKWSCKSDVALLKRMCSTALNEWISAKRCSHCRGTGVTIANLCEKCSGTGSLPVRRKDIAQSCGISRGNWYRDWEGKYMQIIYLITNYENLIIQRLYTIFKE